MKKQLKALKEGDGHQIYLDSEEKGNETTKLNSPFKRRNLET